MSLQLKIKRLNNFELFIIPFIITILVFRLFLYFFESADLFIYGYNVHHLFTGAFILLLTMPFILFGFSNRVKNTAIIMSGVASAMIVDEIIYLPFTNGSNAAYYSDVSTIGTLILSMIIIVYFYVMHKKAPKDI